MAKKLTFEQATKADIKTYEKRIKNLQKLLETETNPEEIAHMEEEILGCTNCIRDMNFDIQMHRAFGRKGE